MIYDYAWNWPAGICADLSSHLVVCDGNYRVMITDTTDRSSGPEQKMREAMGAGIGDYKCISLKMLLSTDDLEKEKPICVAMSSDGQQIAVQVLGLQGLI